MLNIESLFNLFKPVFKFFYDVVQLFQRSAWDVLSEDVFNDWVTHLLELFPGLVDKLTQWTFFQLCLGSGLVIVLIATVVNFFIDSIFPG